MTTTPMQEPAGLAGPASSGSSRPTGTPSTVSRSREPKFVIRSTATVWPPGVTRDEVPMPPLKPRHDMPVPEPTAPSAGGVVDPRDASASSCAARTSSAVTHIRRQSLRKESSHSATTGMQTSSATSGCRASSSSHAASYTRPSCMVDVSQTGVSSIPASRIVTNPVHSPIPFRTAPPATTGRCMASSASTSEVTPVHAVSRVIVAWPRPTPVTSSTELVGPVGSGPIAMPRSRARGIPPSCRRHPVCGY